MFECNEPESKACWFAVITRPRREKMTVNALREKGLETYLPLYRVRRHWSDRIKQLEAPLFPGYAFCRFRFAQRLPVLTTPGVQDIVRVGRSPAPVSDDEIAAIQAALASGLSVEPWPFLGNGQRVRIERGILAGLEGHLVQVKDAWRVVLTVELLQRSVALEISRDFVAPVNPSGYAGNARKVFLSYACNEA